MQLTVALRSWHRAAFQLSTACTAAFKAQALLGSCMATPVGVGHDEHGLPRIAGKE